MLTVPVRSAGAALSGAMLSTGAVVAPSVAAVVGAALEPLPLQAPRANAATSARAPRRVGAW